MRKYSYLSFFLITYTIRYFQNTNKCTRERNVERIKYILYSQLGNINRVPTNASRQHLPAPTASKRFFVAPGNSMVSSTKTANISNMQNSQTLIPTIHNSQYKNVKPRYLNPKPVKNPNVDPSKKPAIPQNVMLNGKKMSKPNNSAKVKDVCKKNVCKTSYVRDSSSAQKNNFENRLNSGSFNSNQKAIELKKPKCSIDHGENQTKTLVKNPPIFYVSPYSFKPSDNLKSQKNTSQMIGKIYNSQKSVEKHKEGLKVSSMHIEKNRSLTESMSVEKRNISVSDTALSIDTKKNFKDSPRSTYNKSPTFKRSTHENSSSYSSPVSHSSVKTNSTIFGSPKLKREIPNQNIIKSFSTKDVAKSKCSNFKGKSLPTFAQSTVSSSAKIIQKSVNEFIPNSQALNSAKTANICDIIDIPLKNLDDSLPNENNVCTLMSRSRTFLKKEPSIISKEITLDSSIEMYPE